MNGELAIQEQYNDKGLAVLVFGWAIAVFLILYIVRQSIDYDYYPTCQYTARSLPSTGLFPFVQSFICNVDNKCSNLSNYEEVPQYKNARLTGIAKQLENAFTNETIVSVVKSIPNMIVLLKAVGNGLDSPDLEGFFGDGILINSLFTNPNTLKRDIKISNPDLDAEIVDEIFNSSLKVGYLFKSFASTDMNSVICDPEQLQRFLILQEPKYIDKVSEEICNINGELVPSLIQNVFDHADFNGLLQMVGKVMDHFRNYDMFEDIRSLVEVFLGLNFMEKNIPPEVKLKEWLPEIIPLMKNINRTHLDSEFINKSLEVIQPHFMDSPLWPRYKNMILHITSLLESLQNKILLKGPLMSQNAKNTSVRTFAGFMNQLQQDIQKISNPSEEDIINKQETLIKIVNDTLNILPVFYFDSTKPWINIANIMDSLTAIVGNKYMNQVSTMSFIYSKAIDALHNTLEQEDRSEKIMYNLCEKHSDVVSTLFSLGPEFIKNMLHCFVNVTCASIIVENRNNLSQLFCDTNKIETIFPETKNIDILCNFKMDTFIEDLESEFNLNWINKTVIETDKQLNDINNKNFYHDNFISAVENTENLIEFVSNRKHVDNTEISWEQLFPDFENTEWSDIANKARRNAGLYIVNVQLCYLKESVKHKQELNQILNISSVLMEGFLTQCNLFPKPLAETLLLHLPSVVETIIKTFTNKTQLMTLASIDDWEQYFCNSTTGNENVDVVAKIACEKLRYLDIQQRKPISAQPLVLAIHKIIKNVHNHKDVNWDHFISNSQNIYLTLSEILNLHIPHEKWTNLEVFQSNYWLKWMQTLDVETELRFGIQLLSKIADFIERNYNAYMDPVMVTRWHQIESTTSSVNQFVVFVMELINFATSSENNTIQVSNLYPKTYNLSQIVIQNFDVLIMDLNKVIDNDNTNMKELFEWFQSPCTNKIQEILLNFSVQSAYTLIQIQEAFCNSTKYEEEWKLAGVLARQNKSSIIHGHEIAMTVSRFNKMLHEVQKLNPKRSNLKIETLLETEKKLNLANKEISFQKIVFNILDKILETNTARQEKLSDLWKELKSCQENNDESCKSIEEDTARYTAKFIATALQEISIDIMQYLQLINGTGVDPLRLIGFSNTSAIYTTYEKFPDLLQVFIHSYRSSEFEDKIFEKRSMGKAVRCNEVINILKIPENNSVTPEDLSSLARYICPSFFDWPIMSDNLFLAMVSKLQTIYLDRPVSKLNVTFVSVSNTLFDLKTNIFNMLKYGKVNINQLWNDNWVAKMKNTFEDIKKLKFDSNTTLTRYFKYIDLPNDELNISRSLVNPKFGFGDFTFFLQHVTNSINDFTSLNITTTNSTQKEIEEIQNLMDLYSKEITSILSYIYFKNPKNDFIYLIKDICTKVNRSVAFNEIILRSQVEKFGKTFHKIVCNPYFEDESRYKLLFPRELENIKNYDVNLEEIFINFISTLQNFVNNSTTIHLSSTLAQQYDFVKIYSNKTYPTDAELRNSSLDQANLLNELSRWEVRNMDEELQFNTVLLKLLKGGNWWQTLMTATKNEHTIHLWLQILENIPTIIIHLADAAIAPHLLHDITLNVVKKGPKALCSPYSNLNVKNFVKDDNIVAIVQTACGYRSKPNAELFDLYVNSTGTYWIYNADKIAEHIYDFEKTLIELLQQGSKKWDLPKWMNETEILLEYENYAKQNSKPLKLLQIVITVINEIIDIGSIFYKNQPDCPWCTWATVLVREINQQLSNSQKYMEFLCEAPNMNITQIRNTLVNDFRWGEFFEKVVSNQTYSVDEFDREIHDAADIIRIQLITFYTNKTLQALPQKCFAKIADAPALKNISTYISAVKELTSTLKQSSLRFLQTPLFTNLSAHHLSEVVEVYIPVFKPITYILKTNNTLKTDLKMLMINNSVINDVLLCYIDVNTLSNIKNAEDMEKYLSRRDYFHKLLSFNNYTKSQAIHNELKAVEVHKLAKVLYESIDENKLNEKITEWRHEGMKSLNWVSGIFNSLETVIANGGDILKFIANIDFTEFSTGNVNISNLLKGVLELLEKKSIEKLFQSMREFVKGMSPFIQDEQLENDLYVLLDGIEDLKIFKRLGLLRIRYKISDLVKDWKNFREYLVTDIHLEPTIADSIYNATIDLSEIMSSQENSLNLKSMICDPKKILDLIHFNSKNTQKVAEEVSSSLCNMSMINVQNLAVTTFKHINLAQVMSSVMNTTVNNILSTANMSEDQGRQIVKNIAIGSELLPYLKNMITNISGDMDVFPKFNNTDLKPKADGSISLSPDLLASGSTLLCGRPLVQSSNKFYKTIAKAKDFNADNYDVIEQKTLPTDFCRYVYKYIVNMELGKLIWAYIKPLIRGQILYTPNTPEVRKILQKANTTFDSIAEMEDILFKITDSLVALEDRQAIEHTLDNIQNFMNSSVVQMVIQNVMKNVTGSNFNLKNLNLKNTVNGFGNTENMRKTLNFSTDFLRCVLLDRFVGVETEEELEDKAKQLMKTNEFIAGIVFLNMNKRQKRSTEIPNDITYKIRMDIDSVRSTSTLKHKFWSPGPESDFLDELRYFRGFIQLQDLIDNAIIQLKAPEDFPKWDTLTQEVPNSCWTRDFFKSALAVSQSFQVCFFFGLIAVVAAAVRYVVWEKESGNTMVMNVMGLKYLTHCSSWFIITFIEMLFVIIAIFLIIKVGGVVPMTNSVLLFLYLLDFGFSVIMFCYMISSIFKSASLAAVGSAIFYLLSYMPYIIIISLETSLEFWSKMITNLSMSSSFCYGCLYIIRYELQGIGLQWNNVWDTPIPEDTMNFGLTCIFLLIDGILYGIIGYICSRKSQGENYLDDTISNTSIVNDEPLKIGVTIKGLTKIYNSRKKTVKAIEDIDITLYTGQVTTLLGHNGAGKTTLIKILTGMMQPTTGQIIINSEITEYEKDKSRFLGVCPQASVLIDTMTPMEHLIFYAVLKTQKTKKEVLPEVMDMIDSMNLGRLSNEPVSHLSEGMRRRLCVAIAFIGKPKLVVLDEPSSGVDPVARRQIWDLVIRYKEGSTVLLTTHYLDEAELLSDRVVVLHKGKVLCSGSPLVLRQSYGSGYKVTISYPEEKKMNQVNDTTVNAVVSLVKKITPNAFLSEIRGFTVDITVPFNTTDGVPNDFENVAAALEENQLVLGFFHFNMNCATLEQVFLDLCEQADAKDEFFIKNSDSISQLGKSYSNVFSNSIDEISNLKEDEVLINTGEKLTGCTLNKFAALLHKRAIHCFYDWRVIVCALILPTLFTAVAMGFSLIRPPSSNEPALKLSPELYKQHTTSFISVDTNDMNSFVNKVSKEIVGLSPHPNLDMYLKTSRNCVCEEGKQYCSKSSNPVYDSLLKLSTANETVEWIVETQNEYYERRYGGWSLSDQYPNKSAMIVWFNNKGYHSMPSYLNSLNSAILRTVSPGSTITTYNHPLKLSMDQLSKSSVAQHIADVGIAMVLLIAFSLVPAAGSIYLVQERVNEEKRMQFLCGVSPTLYWCVAFIWDIIVLLCALLLSVIVFKIFGLPVYVSRDNLAAVSLLIFLYGWACIPFVHLAQRFFTDASMANMILFCICAFIGISELTCLLLMDILGKTQFVADFRDVLHMIYLVFPQFVLGDGLVEISKNNIQSEILQRFHMDTYISPLSWELMGVHYLSLAIVGIVFFLINIVIENEWFKISKRKSPVFPTETSCLEIVNLTKIYNTVSGKYSAVNDISLQVPFGQCLGLIGVNGAGKSTTFKMLTTELRPTSGRIFLQGREICRKPLYTGEMGYCPQCDALDPKLTVRQTLKLYLTLRGIDNKNEILRKMMSKFELTCYANRKTENLSGGNRRKLCTALSVLGKTSLILMDEPTSGMDPYSRNLIGITIQQLTKQNRSVILTSHSVEDCETLCSNIAVMINGRVICQGSPQNLKERYGAGYIISVRLAKPTDQDLLLELMKKYFPGAEQMSRQYCSSQYAVPIIKTTISEMFSKMKKISEYTSVEDYNLVQSSLDQVFINLANNSEATNNVDYKTLPNMYSMDIIH